MSFLPLLAPILLLAAAVVLLCRPLPRNGLRVRLPELAALAALATALLSVVLLLDQGPGTSPLIGDAGVGLSVRLDVISVTMLTLVSFVGWVVLRFAATYSDGEVRQNVFLGFLSLTLAAVLLLVIAGNLFQLVVAWTAIGVTLNRLLLFYPDRVPAQRAARKKALTGYIGTAALVTAVFCLVSAYGTSDIAEIAQAARSGAAPNAALWAAGLLAIAAIFKSAQAPVHGWLTEVMEAPTPVSALLHAGVVNAGGFLLIRFADVLVAAPGVMAVLVIVGGFSALFGGLVMLTQPSVKTSLAWSTLAQMGFMIMQCGLALFPLALLHIVAHSLYKAHAFLASGTAVATVASIQRPGPVAVPGAGAVLRAFAIALSLYVVVGLAFGFWTKSPQVIALGAILIFGMAYLLAQGLAEAAPRALTLRTAGLAGIATVGYFTLQTVTMMATQGALPPVPPPGPLEWALIILALVSFGAVAVAQATFPNWAGHPAAAGLRVHLTNGLYLNALSDRVIGGWSTRKST